MTLALLKSGMTAIAFETMQLSDGSTPLLDPMSAIAGRIALLMGTHYLSRKHGGGGLLIGGVPGVPPATVVIIGCGIVGSNAAHAALGLGGHVIGIDKNISRLRYLEENLHGRFETLVSNSYDIARVVKGADILIGAVLVPGARPPIVVTREMVKTMKPGSVIVDVAIDQGGCIETSRPTTHDNPIYIEENVIHYCVPNMPAIYPHTAAIALSNATISYALRLANQGFPRAVLQDECLSKGVNIYHGKVTNELVAKSLELDYTPLSILLK